MISRANALLAFTLAAPLVYLYLTFLSWLVTNRVIQGANYIEVSILVAQLIRLVVVLSVRSLRMASIALLWNIFSLEAFSFVAVTALYLWSGNSYLITVFLTIVGAWPAALLCVVPVYVIYRLTYCVWSDRRLLSVIPAAVTLFTLLAFVTYALSSQPAPHGLGGLSSLLLSALRQTHTIELSPQVVLAGVPLYLSLLTYATIQDAGLSARRNSVLLLAALGTLVAIGLAIFAAYISSNPAPVFGVPAALLVSVMWWMTRAR